MAIELDYDSEKQVAIQAASAQKLKDAQTAKTGIYKPEVLVPVGEGPNGSGKPAKDAKEIRYVDLEEYRKVHPGFDNKTDKKDLLYFNHSGAYLTIDQAKAKTFVGHISGKEERKEAVEHYFNAKIARLGLDPTIPEKVKKEPDDKSLGVLVRDNNAPEGEWKAISPKNEGLPTLKDAQQKYGENNVLIQIRSDSYLDPELTRRYSKSPNAVERAYSKLSGEPVEKPKKQIDEVFVRYDKHTYLSVSAYRELAQLDPKLSKDTKDWKILIQSPNGHSVLPPDTIARFHGGKDVLNKILQRNGIDDPENVTFRKGPPKHEDDFVPSKLVAVNARTLKSGEAVSEAINGKPLLAAYASADNYVAKLNKLGRQTGGFEDLETKLYGKSVEQEKYYLQENGYISKPENKALDERFSVETLKKRYETNAQTQDKENVAPAVHTAPELPHHDAMDIGGDGKRTRDTAQLSAGAAGAQGSGRHPIQQDNRELDQRSVSTNSR